MLSNQKDLKAEIAMRQAIIASATGPQSVAVSNSGVAFHTNYSANQAVIDRKGESTWANSGGTGGPANADLAQSCVFDLVAMAGANSPVLTSVTANIRTTSDSTGATGWANYVPPTVPGLGSNPGNLVAGTACGLATQLGCTVFGTPINMGVDLTGNTAKRYWQIDPTPTFAAGSSTIYLESHVALGGFGDLPIFTPSTP